MTDLAEKLAEVDGFLDLGESDSPTTPFRPLNPAELFALALPELESLVEGLVHRGTFGIISGREKSGKGLLSTDYCGSIATGEPYIDAAVMEGASVYCAAEEHIRDVRERVAARIGRNASVPFYVLPLDGSTGDRLSLDIPASIARLEGMIKEIRPLTVVLDPLRELHSGVEDSSDEMVWRLRPLREIAHRTNTTIIVTHHMSKAGGFRGSTAIRAATDFELAFTRSDDAGADVVAGTLRRTGRQGPDWTRNIRFDPATGRWSPTVMVAVEDTSLRGRILRALTDVGTWVTTQHLAELLGANLKTVQNEISRMVKESPAPFAVSPDTPRRFHTLTPELISPDSAPVGIPSFPPLKGWWEGKEYSQGFREGSGSENGQRVCVECGEPVSGGDLYCPAHSAKSSGPVREY